MTIVLPAVDGVNFARLYDWLLARDHQVEQELGMLFEEFIHSKLEAAFSESPIGSILTLSKAPGVLVRHEKISEEIDLAFLVGSKLFVCELKSTQYPTEPLEHLTYRNRLTEAAEQARRKVAFVEANLVESIEQLGIKLKGSVTNIEVHPLIVTSSTLLAGWTWNGVGVTDWLILHRFFVEGKLELLGYHNDDGELVHTISEKFYKSSDEAELGVVNYFKHAPQVRLFEAFLKPCQHYLPIFNKTEKPKVTRSFSVQLPHEAMRRVMDAKRQATERSASARL